MRHLRAEAQEDHERARHREDAGQGYREPGCRHALRGRVGDGSGSEMGEATQEEDGREQGPAERNQVEADVGDPVGAVVGPVLRRRCEVAHGLSPL